MGGHSVVVVTGDLAERAAAIDTAEIRARNAAERAAYESGRRDGRKAADRDGPLPDEMASAVIRLLRG